SITSTGVWTSQFGSVTSNVFGVDWRTQPSLYGPIGLLDASRGDRIYVATYTQMPSYFTMDHYVNAALMMSDGVPTAVAGSLNAATPTSCVHVATQYAAR